MIRNKDVCCGERRQKAAKFQVCVLCETVFVDGKMQKGVSVRKCSRFPDALIVALLFCTQQRRCKLTCKVRRDRNEQLKKERRKKK